MQSAEDVSSQVLDLFVRGVPKFLLTAWEYLILRPRRFFLQREQSRERYMEPWPYLVLCASVAAALAVLVGLSQGTIGEWEWPPFFAWLFVALSVHLAIVVCGALAALLTRQRVSARGMLSAFAYAGTWLPAYIPLFAAVVARADVDAHSALPYALFGIELCQIGYLVTSFARFHYMEGRRFAHFVVVTSLLVILLMVLVVAAVRRFPEVEQWRQPQISIQHTFSPWCDHAVLNGHVQTSEEGAMVWFEWGTTPRLGQRTETALVKGSADLEKRLDGLAENTTYYYRLVLSGQDGEKRGWLQSLTTAPCR